MFTAFSLAVLASLINLLSLFIGGKVIDATASVLLSSLATYLLNAFTIKEFIVTTVAGAFLGTLLLSIGEMISSVKPRVFNINRQ